MRRIVSKKIICSKQNWIVVNMCALSAVHNLMNYLVQVSADAVSLANALRGDNKSQGNWGEFVLEKLLEDSEIQRKLSR